jgi:hypothetical protein
MQLTHEEAHRLIQFNLDDALDLQGKTMLSAHLKDCIECRIYAEEIREVGSILVPVMKRHWNLQPIPFSISALNVKRNPKIQTSTMLATRTAVIGVVVLMFIFSVWQFAISGRGSSAPLPVRVLPVPTPSTQSTSTKIMFQNCDGIRYTVQENDTIESIAYQFLTSKEDLMAANNIRTETVSTGMELIVPICNFTPTGTIHPTLLATTYTPPMRPTTFTPDG